MQIHFTVRSETYAEKTRRLLERYRYHYQMQKITSREGCNYHFSVAADADQLSALLNANRIPYQTAAF